jgi:hypothetical protein
MGGHSETVAQQQAPREESSWRGILVWNLDMDG